MHMNKRPQQGFFLLEALIAILIFSLGILGMVAMGGAAIAAQSDAQYRSDAANLANEISSTIALNVDRFNAGSSYGSNALSLAGTLTPFQHRATGQNCAFSGAPSAKAEVTGWVGKVSTIGPGLPGLPGATSTSQQILVATGAGFNRLTVTICWQAPNDKAVRQHTLVSYIN